MLEVLTTDVGLGVVLWITEGTSWWRFYSCSYNHI